MYVNTYMVQALDDAVEVVGAVCEVLQLVHGASEVRSEPMELVLQDLRLLFSVLRLRQHGRHGCFQLPDALTLVNKTRAEH